MRQEWVIRWRSSSGHMIRFKNRVVITLLIIVFSVFKQMPFRDFHRLLIVCLKMLFRKTTRKRFVFLVAAFMFMMAFNSYSYVMRFHKSEIQKQDLLNEKAFKVFFLRSRTRADCARFLSQHGDKLREYGSRILKGALIYQTNLYIHFYQFVSVLLD